MGRRIGHAVALASVFVVAQAAVAWAGAGDLDTTFSDDGFAVLQSDVADRTFLDVAADASGRYVAAGVDGDGADVDVVRGAAG